MNVNYGSEAAEKNSARPTNFLMAKYGLIRRVPFNFDDYATRVAAVSRTLHICSSLQATCLFHAIQAAHFASPLVGMFVFVHGGAFSTPIKTKVSARQKWCKVILLRQSFAALMFALFIRVSYLL